MNAPSYVWTLLYFGGMLLAFIGERIVGAGTARALTGVGVLVHRRRHRGARGARARSAPAPRSPEGRAHAGRALRRRRLLGRALPRAVGSVVDGARQAARARLAQAGDGRWPRCGRSSGSSRRCRSSWASSATRPWRARRASRSRASATRLVGRRPRRRGRVRVRALLRRRRARQEGRPQLLPHRQAGRVDAQDRADDGSADPGLALLPAGERSARRGRRLLRRPAEGVEAARGAELRPRRRSAEGQGARRHRQRHRRHRARRPPRADARSASSSRARARSCATSIATCRRACSRWRKPARNVYFVSGHGERTFDPIGDTDKRATVRDMRELLPAAGLHGAPARRRRGPRRGRAHDAALVVIVGPQKPLLARGGRRRCSATSKRAGASSSRSIPKRATSTSCSARSASSTSRRCLCNDLAMARKTNQISDRQNIVTASYSSHPSVTTLGRYGGRAPLIMIGAGHFEEQPKDKPQGRDHRHHGARASGDVERSQRQLPVRRARRGSARRTSWRWRSPRSTKRRARTTRTRQTKGASSSSATATSCPTASSAPTATRSSSSTAPSGSSATRASPAK